MYIVPYSALVCPVQATVVCAAPVHTCSANMWMTVRPRLSRYFDEWTLTSVCRADIEQWVEEKEGGWLSISNSNRVKVKLHTTHTTHKHVQLGLPCECTYESGVLSLPTKQLYTITLLPRALVLNCRTGTFAVPLCTSIRTYTICMHINIYKTPTTHQTRSTYVL